MNHRIKSTVLAILVGCMSLFAQLEGDTSNVQIDYPFGKKGESSRGFYGTDDRQEVTAVYGYSDLVDATVVMVPKSAINGNRIRTSSLRESLSRRYGIDRFHENVAFLDQPTCAECTGFFIAPGIIATAGHCVNFGDNCNDYVWLVDYDNKLRHKDYADYVEFDPNDIYECSEIMDWEYSDETYMDYAFIKTKKETTRAPYQFRTNGEVKYWQDIFMIGAPTGLPLKLVDNAKVTSTLAHPLLFVTSLDHFPGNSGGPVFDDYGWIEAIHVRGYTTKDWDNSNRSDYIYDAECNCIKTVSFASHYGKGSYELPLTLTNYDILIQAIYENLEYAIRKNDATRLKRWLSYSWVLEEEYTKQRGRLEVVAAKMNRLELLKLIMDKSEEKQIVDDRGRNLLFHAISNGNIEMLEFLLDKGVNPNHQDKIQETALIYAIEKQQVGAVRSLLKYGARVSTTSLFYGQTPLHYAARVGNIEIAGLLLDNGANIHAKSSRGWTAIKTAKKSKQKAMKKYLKRRKKELK